MDERDFKAMNKQDSTVGKMNRFTLLHLEWNYLNGFIFQFCGIDLQIEKSLFGIYLSRDFIHIEIMFVYFEIWNRN
jgi:hypothetical protein